MSSISVSTYLLSCVFSFICLSMYIVFVSMCLCTCLPTHCLCCLIHLSICVYCLCVYVHVHLFAVLWGLFYLSICLYCLYCLCVYVHVCLAIYPSSLYLFLFLSVHLAMRLSIYTVYRICPSIFSVHLSIIRLAPARAPTPALFLLQHGNDGNDSHFTVFLSFLVARLLLPPCYLERSESPCRHSRI